MFLLNKYLYKIMIFKKSCIVKTSTPVKKSGTDYNSILKRGRCTTLHDYYLKIITFLKWQSLKDTKNKELKMWKIRTLIIILYSGNKILTRSK